ncbi:hypothetical protein [Meiothermus sp.]|uniref:hypothetical protein n=1 Tax=Meiothermus sp. TaxID=1955249 RepID=UPI00307F0387
MNFNPTLLKAAVDQHMAELLERAQTEQLLRTAPMYLSARHVLPPNPNNLPRKRVIPPEDKPKVA